MTTSSEWDAGLLKLGSRDLIHAVGAFALYYNDLELSLYRFFQLLLSLSYPPRAFLFFSLHNRERADFIKLLAAEEKDTDAGDAILHAVKCCDICAENRNLLLHGVPANFDDETITIAKHIVNQKGQLRFYRFDVATVREAAASASGTCDYIATLTTAIEARRAFQPKGLLDTPPPLPDRPPQPRKLSLPPQQGDDAAAISRPRSSRRQETQ